MERKDHWEKIFQEKKPQEVSWFQPVPETSLYFVDEYQLPLTANIIDVGGGDSFFVDHLLDRGYKNITVVDISEAALERAKERLANQASVVTWIIADMASFNPPQKYDFWHDRAAFHFLTGDKEIENYLDTVSRCVNKDGFFVLGTFSQNGPKKCSGIEIKQYSTTSMTSLIEKHGFLKLKCFNIDHVTPFGTTQNFTFCSFKK